MKYPIAFKYLSLVIFIICFSSVVVLQSRAFILGYVCSIVFIILSFNAFKINPKTKLLGVVGFFVVIFSLTFGFKSDSSFGRMLIYKISLKILKDNYLSGVGWNKFAWVYGEYQIKYFRNGAFSTKEILLADNTKHAFNDYLQFVIETGMLGLASLTLLTVFIVASVTLSLKRHEQYPPILTLAISQMIALSVAALFMHVLEKPAFQCLFIAALIIVLYYAYFPKHKLYKCYCIMLLIVGAIIFGHYNFYIKNFSNYKKTIEAKELYQMGFIKEAFIRYKALYPTLKIDIEFLSEYANVLTSLNYHKKAEAIMENVVLKDNASMFYEKLADCYLKNGKMEKAEKAYLKAVYRVPNRFSTRLSLFRFYHKTLQFKKATVTGETILNLPIKIPSLQVQEIKKEVANTLASQRVSF